MPLTIKCSVFGGFKVLISTKNLPAWAEELVTDFFQTAQIHSLGGRKITILQRVIDSGEDNLMQKDEDPTPSGGKSVGVRFFFEKGTQTPADVAWSFAKLLQSFATGKETRAEIQGGFFPPVLLGEEGLSVRFLVVKEVISYIFPAKEESNCSPLLNIAMCLPHGPLQAKPKKIEEGDIQYSITSGEVLVNEGQTPDKINNLLFFMSVLWIGDGGRKKWAYRDQDESFILDMARDLLKRLIQGSGIQVEGLSNIPPA